MDSLCTKNRIRLLNKLMTDESSGEIDDAKYESLLTDKYDDFIEICELVENEADSIEDIKCHMEDGELKFEIIRK